MYINTSFTNLLKQHISNMTDEIISGVLRMGWSLTAFLQCSKEVSVKEQQGVQAREDLGHAVPVKLQLLQHAFPEHLRHDCQGLDVVQLCLHQLYKRGVIMDTEMSMHVYWMKYTKWTMGLLWKTNVWMNLSGTTRGRIGYIDSSVNFNKFLKKGHFCNQSVFWASNLAVRIA